MAEKCVNLGCPEVLRLALADACTGAPIPGASNGMVLRCQRNVTIEARVRDADVSEFVSDCGNVDEYTLDAFVQGYNVSFESARISPELQALLLGYDMLAIGGENVGFIEEASVGCTTQTVRPSFIVEAFYRVRQCDPGGGSNYLRRIIQGVKFNPVENDKEGQIGFERFSGQSVASLTEGLVNPVSTTAGPYQDVPADIYTELAALPAGHLNVGLRFVDPIADPVSGITLAAGTCYTATVPVDA
jgi:hypothetical protein